MTRWLMYVPLTLVMAILAARWLNPPHEALMGGNELPILGPARHHSDITGGSGGPGRIGTVCASSIAIEGSHAMSVLVPCSFTAAGGGGGSAQ